MADNKEHNRSIRHLISVCTLLFVMLFGGSAYYHFVQGMTPVNAIYMTVITLATIGFGETEPLNENGRIFTIFLVFFGVGSAAYGYSVLMSLIIEGHLKEMWSFKRRRKMLSKMTDHYIICGFGRMGKYICKKLYEKELPFVVIEQSDSLESKLKAEGILFIKDDASNEEVLIQAGISRARGLVSVVSSDADNLFICLTARQLNADITIIARVADDSAEPKMIKAGANKVISPYKIGGERMAMALLKPSVLDFIEIATGSREKNRPLKMEEIMVLQGSRLCGQTILESRIRDYTGAIIIAVKKDDGEMIFNPKSDYFVEANDIFISLGSSEHLTLLEELCDVNQS